MKNLFIYSALLLVLTNCQKSLMCFDDTCSEKSTNISTGIDDDNDGNEDGNSVELPDSVEVIDDKPTIDGSTPSEAFMVVDVTFASGSDTLSEDFKNLLQEFSLYLLSKNTAKVVIYGHTDSRGGSLDNQNLSDRRAHSVASYLSSFDYLSSVTWSHKGLGEARPIADNNTEEGRQRNRRIEIYTFYK